MIYHIFLIAIHLFISYTIYNVSEHSDSDEDDSDENLSGSNHGHEKPDKGVDL